MPLADEPENIPIPAHLNRWNWGAFFLNWIWGLGNSTFIALLMFIPIVNIVMLFVLGAKGSKWAWQNRIWLDEAHFVRTQRNWGRAGLAVFLAVPTLIVVLYLGLTSGVKNSHPYIEAMELVREDSRVIASLGPEIAEGLITSAEIYTNGAGGSSIFTVQISGELCKADLHVRANRIGYIWDINLLVVMSECQTEPIVLINSNDIFLPASTRAVDQKNI